MVKTDHKRIKPITLTSKNALTSDDRILWAKVASEVRPLKKATGQSTESRPVKKIGSKKDNYPQKSNPNTSADNIGQDIAFLEHGKGSGMENRTKRRLRRGQIRIEARLDLHGMTQSEAHQRLIDFLEISYSTGCGAVLVITGKGMRSESQKGILRRAVPRWLNQPPLRQFIKAFDYAAPRDGGEGALYVLLRRRR